MNATTECCIADNETHHVWFETIGAVGTLCCGHVKALLGILLAGASIRQNIVDSW